MPDDVKWRNSSYCGTNACVEVASAGGLIYVRDSKNPNIAPLAFTTEEWGAFIRGVRAGEFD